MMGRSHALSGAVAFLAPALALQLPVQQTALGVVVCAGAAVLPDIDHPGSGVSRTFGPVTRTFAAAVGKLSGGHRNGTHSQLGAAVFAALAFTATALYSGSVLTFAVGGAVSGALLFAGWFLGVTDTGRGRGKPAYRRRWHGYVSAWAAGVIALGLLALVILFGRAAGTVLLCLLLILVGAAVVRLLKIKGRVDDVAPIPAAVLLLYSGTDMTVVPYAVTLGVLVHIAGDMATTGGCPVGWPWSQTMRGPAWFRTNSPVENRVVYPVLWALLGALSAVGVFLRV